MSTLTSLGIGSGLDINKMVSDLVSAERQPASDRLDSRAKQYNQKLSAYGALQSAVSVFNESVQGLKDAGKFVQRTASSGDSAIFTASATADAQPGNYSVEVVHKAQAQKLISAGDAGWSNDTVIGTGTLDISAGGSSFSVDVNADNNTLAGIRDAINSADGNSTVTASIIQVDDSSGNTESRLVLTAKKPGTDNAISVAVSGDGDGNDSDTAGLSALRYDATASNLSENQAAVDAEITVDGQTATRSSNTITDVIPGVTIDLKDTSAGNAETLTVKNNTGAVKSAIQDMVKGYNALVKTLGSLTKYDADTGDAGILLGDAVARGLETQTRQGLMDPVDGLDGSIQSLVDLGISVGDNRQLSIDSEKLDKALSNNLDSVKTLFTSDNGVGTRLDRITDAYIGKDSVIQNRTDGLQSRLSDIADARSALDRRMSNLKQRYLDQFIAMDQIVAQMNSTQDRLTQGLASLPGYTDPNKKG